MSNHHTERVLVVPTALFHRLGHFQGFCRDVDRYLVELFAPENASYRPRNEVEEDPGYKQLIPYMIFRWHDAAGRPQLFQYTRGRGMGEGRLHAKRSVGVGGHISAEDATTPASGSPYLEGMRRELDEEVVVNTTYTQQCVGLINDDLTPVGQVHLGVVHLFDVERPEVHARETDLIESGFRDLDAILSDLTGFETWSEICLKALFQ